MYRHVTFLCGRGGIYAIGAVAASYMGDHQRRDFFLNLFLEVLSIINFHHCQCINEKSNLP